MQPLSTIAPITMLLLAFCGPPATAQPANDNFLDRVAISGNSVSLTDSLANATSEFGEPFLPAISTGQSAWWRWIAPSNGIVTLSVLSTNFNPLLTVYIGESVGDLLLIASNNYVACYESTNCGCHWRERSQIDFHVSRGQAYQIQVDSALITDASMTQQTVVFTNPPVVYTNQLGVFTNDARIIEGFSWGPSFTTNAPAGGVFNFHLELSPAPANDSFANAIQLSGSRTHVHTSNVGGTEETGEPDHLGNSGGSSVWYSWTAPASGRVTLSTNNIPPYAPPSGSGVSDGVIIIGIGPPNCGREIDQEPPPNFYPVFAAYTGNSVDSLTPANNFPLELNAYSNAVAFDAIRGQTYHIEFDGNRGTTGNLNLYLALTKPASNDNFAKRPRLRGIYAVGTGFNAGATHEPGEPPPVNGSDGKSVWWTWTAPVSGPVYLGLEGSDYVGLPISVFTGSTLSDLRCVANGFGGGSTGATTFNAIAGRTYQISVSDWHGLSGAITLTLQAPVVEAPLIANIGRSPQMALLAYAALNGQKVLLQKRTDGRTWQNVGSTLARQSKVYFVAKPAPGVRGALYRAIIIDWR